MKDCVSAAVGAGYLIARDHRGRYARASGAEYAKIVEFVAKQRVEERVGRMLERLCSRPGACTSYS